MIFFLASTGRLGNQIFHLAALDHMCAGRQRGVLLGSESILEWFEWQDSRVRIRPGHPVRLVKLLRRLVRLRCASYLREAESKTLHGRVYNSEVQRVSRGLLPLTFVENAFFQSDDWVREDFPRRLRFKPSIMCDVDQWEREMGLDLGTAIFCHVRRGDYVDGGGALPPEYYFEGIRRMRASMDVSTVVFVTDDAPYIEAVFRHVPEKVVVSRTPGFDMCVMSKCASGVLSASSFSWWGWRLGPQHAPAIAPRYWLGWRQKFNYPARIISPKFVAIDPGAASATVGVAADGAPADHSKQSSAWNQKA